MGLAYKIVLQGNIPLVEQQHVPHAQKVMPAPPIQQMKKSSANQAGTLWIHKQSVHLARQDSKLALDCLFGWWIYLICCCCCQLIAYSQGQPAISLYEQLKGANCHIKEHLHVLYML